MRWLHLLSFLFLSFYLLCTVSYGQRVLMPSPQKIEYGKGRFLLSSAVVNVPKNFSSDDIKAIDEFISFVKENAGITLSKKYLPSNVSSSFNFKFNSSGS